MKRTKVIVSFLFLLLPLFMLAEFKQELQGSDSLKVGTPFLFKITADFAIKGISLPDTLDDFAILESKRDEKNPRCWIIKIVPLNTGALSFPRIEIQPVDSSVTSIYTDGFRVYVLSVLAEGDTLLRDIKPLQKYPLQLPFWIYLLLLLLALSAGIYLWWKQPEKPKRKYIAQPEIKEPVLPAWEKALKALDELLTEDLLDKGETVLYHFRLSNILRAFLEETYNFPALEMTGREIAVSLNRRNIPQAQEIRKFITYCDLVKFAKREPAAVEIEENTLWLRNYLISFREPTQETENA
ncbi:MAG: hypothetical protein M0R67_03290 [Candidatus Cloacimonas sp.]|jgi:hypothetical protein|nr:hypothetical protein [Candidatus Cloacimonas sp.]HNQ39707.1 hypothetical protein [Candidatus Cloacimonas sp.]HNS84537.1 hypothetical protein [Candidatus Cloacimonas sp.]HPA24767.1 hypothetical protein [Candidatus Cloacimonas sp.]HPX10360.1 hypothetical protein [Candidatus Cloacimonas sp.]